MTAEDAANHGARVTGPQDMQGWLAANMRLGRRAARPAVVLGVLGTVAACIQAWCIAELLSHALGGPAVHVLSWAWGFVAAALLRAVFAFWAEERAFDAGASARRRLRDAAFARLFAAGPAATRTVPAGTVLALAVDRIEALDGLFARWLPAATLAVLSPAVVAGAVLLVDPVAALILLGAGALVPCGMALAGIGAAAASQRQFEALSQLQARFLDRVRGIATIVLANRAADEVERLRAAADDLRIRTMRVLRVAFLSSAALDCAAAAALVLLAMRYAARWSTAADPAPAIFALMMAVEFFAPLRAFAAAYQDRMQASGAADAFAALPDTDAAPAVSVNPRTVNATGVSVAFEGVSFAWDAARGSVLDGLSFRVPAGETIVVVGPSGAGKSTIIELLLGFIQPDAGRITLNGADIATVTPHSLARMTAWIGQKPMLFAGTVRENIRFGRPDATDAELEKAAEAAGVTQFTKTLPDGLDTRVGEGGYGLSGGQAQRVAIARAFVRNAPLLLLDEPTAHLDPATEADVFASLRRLALGRTVILASHSTAAHAFSGRRLDLSGGQAHAVQGAA